MEVRMSVVIQDIHNKHHIHPHTHAPANMLPTTPPRMIAAARYFMPSPPPPAAASSGEGMGGKADLTLSRTRPKGSDICVGGWRERGLFLRLFYFLYLATDDLLLCVCYLLVSPEVPNLFTFPAFIRRPTKLLFYRLDFIQVTSGGSAVP